MKISHTDCLITENPLTHSLLKHTLTDGYNKYPHSSFQFQACLSKIEVKSKLGSSQIENGVNNVPKPAQRSNQKWVLTAIRFVKMANMT